MRFLSYYCILLFFISCTKEHEKIKEEPIKIYSVEDFDTKLSIIDTACINQTNRAESDIKKGKLVLNNFYLFNTKIHIKSFFDNYEQ
jgi:uncharacterized CHY-type Zn-finger protein